MSDIALAMIDVYAGRLPALSRARLWLGLNDLWLGTAGSDPAIQGATRGAVDLSKHAAVLVVQVGPGTGFTEASFYAPPGVATPPRHFDCLLLDPTKPGLRGFPRSDGGWVLVAVAPRPVDWRRAETCTERTFGAALPAPVPTVCESDAGAIMCAGRVLADARMLAGRCTDLAVGGLIERRTVVPDAPEAVILRTDPNGLPPWHVNALRQWGFVSPPREHRSESPAQSRTWFDWLIPKRRRGHPDPPGGGRMRFVHAAMVQDVAALVASIPDADVKRALQGQLKNEVDGVMRAGFNGGTVLLDPRATSPDYVGTPDAGVLQQAFDFTGALVAMFRAVWTPDGPGRFPTEPLSRLLVRGTAKGCFARAWAATGSPAPTPLLMACLAFDPFVDGDIAWRFHGFWAGLGFPSFAAVRSRPDLREAVRRLARATASGPRGLCCAWENAATDAAMPTYRKLAANFPGPFVFDQGTSEVRPNGVGVSPLVLGDSFPEALAEHELVTVKLKALGAVEDDGFVMDLRTVDRESYVVVRPADGSRRLVPVRPLLEMLGEFGVEWIGDVLSRDLVLVLREADVDRRGRPFFVQARFSDQGRRRVWRWLTRGGVLHRCIARRLAQAPVGSPASALANFRWRDAGCALAIETPRDYMASAEAYFLFAPVAICGPGGEVLCTTVNGALVAWVTGGASAGEPERLLCLGIAPDPHARGVLSDEAKAVMSASLSACGRLPPNRDRETTLLHGRGQNVVATSEATLGALVATLFNALPDGSLGQCEFELRVYEGDGPAVLVPREPEGHLILVAEDRLHNHDPRGLLHKDGPIPFCVWALTVACRDLYVTNDGVSAELDDVRRLWGALIGHDDQYPSR